MRLTISCLKQYIVYIMECEMYNLIIKIEEGEVL
ncbi:hypothetical protein BD821_12717 [Clostridium algidicarnis DSM 15099]|uniref:Uncharacterized protein n=1 Tax=Clostridium algidicarnis DSM 15099 TaxID=1121295 RepID=A0A2S6FUI1_9CLOT|nr:hypothetical protein BD821_12717 [Clostridium algidicarnis DSM 15099]